MAKQDIPEKRQKERVAHNGIGQAACQTYEVKIYCGLRVGYSDVVLDPAQARLVCHEFANRVKTCVSVTDTEYVYVGGSEPGIVVGLMNYPRFPKREDEMRAHAEELAVLLMKELRQFRVSMVTPEYTITFYNYELLDRMGEPRE